MTAWRRQDGYTLIELMITILIIGILASIGLGAYNGQRNKAKNSHAANNVRLALGAARAHYLQQETYAGLTPALLREQEATLAATEPAGTTTPGETADPTQIVIASVGTSGLMSDTSPIANANHQKVVLCAFSKGDSGFCIYDNQATGEVWYRQFKGAYTLGNPAGGPYEYLRSRWEPGTNGNPDAWKKTGF